MESERFLEIDRLRVAKLQKLRDVETELVAEKEELRILREVLSKEREVSRSLNDRVRNLEQEIDAAKSRFSARLESSEESSASRASELEIEVGRLSEEINSLKEVISLLGMENKSLKGSASTRQADFSLQIERLNREITDLSESKNRAIAEQRAMIDQLSNSMSEAATQLMETQNASKSHQSEIEKRERKISSLEESLSLTEESVRDKNRSVFELEDCNTQLEKRIDQLQLEKEIMLAQLGSAGQELEERNKLIREMQIMRNKSQLIQTNLVSELQSLPVINKRLESDCAFLRDDVKKIAERMKSVLSENDSINEKLKQIDSLLTPDQRNRLNASGIAKRSESSVITENKRLQIEAMELRMRLVDSQAARDKAQAQLIDQSQLIATLEKDLAKGENISPKNAKDLLQPQDMKSTRTSSEELPECKQQ